MIKSPHNGMKMTGYKQIKCSNISPMVASQQWAIGNFLAHQK
jgi:hypothetical protein